MSNPNKVPDLASLAEVSWLIDVEGTIHMEKSCRVGHRALQYNRHAVSEPNGWLGFDTLLHIGCRDQRNLLCFCICIVCYSQTRLSPALPLQRAKLIQSTSVVLLPGLIWFRTWSISNCLHSPLPWSADCQVSTLCLDVNLDYLVIKEIINFYCLIKSKQARSTPNNFGFQ